LAQTALAGQTQAAQQAAAAQIEKDIALQRMQAGSTLAGLGQGGIGQALGAAQAGQTAANAPFDYFGKYAALAYGAPQAASTPNFAGTQGQTVTNQGYKAGFSI
jgi:hypothetical protein